MVLRDCKKGMVHWPEGDRNIPVLVEKNGDEILLYFKGYKFQDTRFVSEIDFYDLQKGMIVTLAEVVMRKNPAFPESPYPWIGVCDIREVLRIVQRQNDVRVSVAMELPFVKEREKDDEEELHFFGIIRNLSAGGIFMETNVPLKEDDIVRFHYRFDKMDRELKLVVVWIKAGENGRYGYGLRFLRMSLGEESEVRNHVFRLIFKNNKKI
ncbi:PilZ domain-containing protein [Oribacterium asaccharolyticum]|uniref:PilZ domain-containing protein n=1 Tax=Oribacterium asaccharolyticum TaxID=1501332 RepID=UPI0028E941FB|nr:PilZ domain-containing protein [Oribacterium asaccharolyticum]